MKKILSVLLILSLLPAGFLISAAAASSSYESEKGQAMIGPPAPGEDTGGSSENSENQDASSGVDWRAANTAASPAGEGSFTVVIDPGHQGSWVDMSAQEPVAPGSSQTKAKATTGTQGAYSGIPEYEVNLQVSLALEKELTERGYRVVMTRTDNDAAISNKERAELATAENADITVRIHANGSDDPSASGALTMAPTSANTYLDSDVIEKSGTLADCIISHFCTATGLSNMGVISADNMTGTNWSTVPVAILEMGFMSNQNDDLYITNTANHTLMAQSIADGIDEYFSIVEPQTAGVGQHLKDLTEKLETEFPAGSEAAGETWAAAVMDLNTSDYSTIHADQTLHSAGLIKTFIMGTVYEQLVYAESPDTASADYESTLKPLLTQMITADSDEAATELVCLLGGGDFSAGAAIVSQFCSSHGYSSTRLDSGLAAEDPDRGGYTSASDCCRILSEIYRGTLVNENASSEMLSLLRQQTLKTGIPAGLPDGTETAGKTGETTAEGNTGMIENDMAVVLDADSPYVICILSENVRDNAAAQQTIVQISSAVFQYMTETERPSPTLTPAP